MRRPLVIYDFATELRRSEFLIYEGNLIFFFVSAPSIVQTFHEEENSWSRLHGNQLITVSYYQSRNSEISSVLLKTSILTQ
jgi:hypothetical protein